MLGQLVDVDLGFCDSVTDGGLVMLAVGCPQLATLKLSATGVTDVGLGVLAAMCRGLASLNLEHCMVTDTGLAALAAECPQLVSLNTEGCVEVTSAGRALFGGRVHHHRHW